MTAACMSCIRKFCGVNLLGLTVFTEYGICPLGAGFHTYILDILSQGASGWCDISSISLQWHKMSLWSLATRLFVQQLVQTSIRKHQRSKLLAFCEGNSVVTGGFPSQRATIAEIVSMSWHQLNKSRDVNTWQKWLSQTLLLATIRGFTIHIPCHLPCYSNLTQPCKKKCSCSDFTLNIGSASGLVSILTSNYDNIWQH